MFKSIINTTVQTGTLSFRTAGSCVLAALIMGAVIAIAYYYSVKGRTSRGFVGTLVLIPVLVQTIIMLVNGNLGAGVAILGAFSLIRFRSIPGNSREISSIFFSMVTGLTCGMGYITYAAAITAFTCVVMLLVNCTPFRTRSELSKNLRITIHEDLDYTDVFEDIFQKYLKSWDRTLVKTVNMGSMYQLFYDIQLKDPKEEKEFLDELRCRNGNLTIQCGNLPENPEQL